ncbi:hypothetical protein [truncated ORF], partial [Aspergillus niger]|uniref:Uncharacterized protein n=2 Tax=Aspergillus niger TaxID=5061 RepID=A0AAJ8BMF7_ASPNG
TILVYPGDSPISRSVPFHIRIGTLSAERAEAIRPSKAAIVDMDANRIKSRKIFAKLPSNIPDSVIPVSLSQPPRSTRFSSSQWHKQTSGRCAYQWQYGVQP